MDPKLSKELLHAQIKRSMVFYYTTTFHCKPLNMYDFICDNRRVISNDFCALCGNYKDLWLKKGIPKCLLCTCK